MCDNKKEIAELKVGDIIRCEDDDVVVVFKKGDIVKYTSYLEKEKFTYCNIDVYSLKHVGIGRYRFALYSDIPFDVLKKDK